MDSLMQKNNEQLISIIKQHTLAQKKGIEVDAVAETALSPSVFSQKVQSKSFNSLNMQQKNRTHPVNQLKHVEHAQQCTTSPRLYDGMSSKGSLQFEAEASQSSFSFAFTPSQKPLFIQSVYLASLTKKLLNSWQDSVLNNPQKKKKVGEPQLNINGKEDRKYEEDQLQDKLMSNLSNLDDQQLLTKMLTSLQVTLSFVQNLQEGIQVDELVNLCEIKQIWETVFSQIRLSSSSIGNQAHREEVSEVSKQLSEPLKSMSRMYSNKCLKLSMYKQAITSKGNDAQLMLKAYIDDLMALKAENAKLKETIQSKKFEQRYCASHQHQSHESISTLRQFAQSFGARQQPNQNQDEDEQKYDQSCVKCLEMQLAQFECEEQIKEGKSKMQESAIIVQEVARELKKKDELIQQLASKLLQILLIIDNGKNYDLHSQNLTKLSEIVYQKVASLFQKCVKQKKQNKSFQDAMLNELDGLNKALIDKKKKGKRQQPQHGEKKREINEDEATEEQQEGPSRTARKPPIKQQKQKDEDDNQQRYLSLYGRNHYGGGAGGKRDSSASAVVERASSITSTGKENQQFLNVFRSLKDQMIRHQSPRQQQHPNAQYQTMSQGERTFSPHLQRQDKHRVLSSDSMRATPPYHETTRTNQLSSERSKTASQQLYENQRYLFMSSSSATASLSQFSPHQTLQHQPGHNQNRYREGIQLYRNNMEDVINGQRFLFNDQSIK